MNQRLSTVEILIHSLKVFKIRMMFLGYCGNFKKKTTPEKQIKNSSQKKKLNFIFLNTYQNSQIVASASLNMIRHVVSATN